MCEKCDFCGRPAVGRCIICGRCFCDIDEGTDGYCYECFTAAATFDT
ncbi:MAG: hypothetical protein K8E24_007265 [Methanobacterium paludis]|nr:hypothetical protein [Methanobacterium paludis]